MKIVISSSYKVGGETGVAVVASELAKKLSDKHEVMYVCLGAKYAKNKSKNVTVVTLPSVFIKVAHAPIITPKIHKALKADLEEFGPAIIHSQNVLLVDLLCIAWGVNNHVPVLVTFHQLPTDAIYHVLPGLAGHKLGRAINYPYSKIHTKRLLNYVNAVIALNGSVSDSIREISDVNIYRLNNGLDLSTLSGVNPKEQSINKRFIFLGSYFPRKNQEFLINAFSYLPNHYHLDLYGNKKSGGVYLRKLYKLIKDKNITNVSVHDFVPRVKIHKVYGSADYLVSASKKEAQSLVIIEALASATPIIGLSNETLDELVDEKTGLVMSKSTSPKLFAKRLEEFVENCDYAVLATNARKRSKNFDIDTVTKKLLDIYKKTIFEGPKKTTKGNKLLEYLLPESEYRRLFNHKIANYMDVAVGLTIFVASLAGIAKYLPTRSRK